MRKAYLTIDDSPSAHSDALIAGLVARGVPALLFCRGDLLDSDPAPMVRAIAQGMVLGNHGYVHKRAGALGFESVCESILRTENLLNACYRDAGAQRPGKYFRFPYIDRGDGDLLERRFGDLIGTGSVPENADVRRLQDWLSAQGFTQPFKGVTHPLYQAPQVRNARDCLFTYSTGDWMLNARYKGTQPLQSLVDVTAAMEDDPYLMDESGTQIILIHDHDEITNEALGIVDYLLNNDFTFEGY